MLTRLRYPDNCWQLLLHSGFLRNAVAFYHRDLGLKNFSKHDTKTMSQKLYSIYNISKTEKCWAQKYQRVEIETMQFRDMRHDILII